MQLEKNARFSCCSRAAAVGGIVYSVLFPLENRTSLALLISVVWIFLRTARSFYGSLWYLLMYLLTYLRTYVQVIFRRIHPTLKLIKQKMSKILQVNVPNFFILLKSKKMTKLGPKNRFWDLKIKINRSRSNPTMNPSFFEIQT